MKKAMYIPTSASPKINANYPNAGEMQIMRAQIPAITANMAKPSTNLQL